MGATPQPPRPPAAPEPPRSGSNIVPIVLLIVALVVVVAGLAVWTGARFLSRTVQVEVDRGSSGGKDVSIRTPVGDFEVHKQADISEARLGLPFYPGARRVTDKDSVALSMNFPGEQNVNVIVGKFDTSDPVDKVTEFYQKRIGDEVTKFTQHDATGKTVFEIKQDKQVRVVALKPQFDGTRIELVRVTHGEAQAN